MQPDKERLKALAEHIETYAKILDATDDDIDRSRRCVGCRKKVPDAYLGCCADCLRLIASTLLRAEEGEKGWQPIESAPKDGDLHADVWAVCSAVGGEGERYADSRRRDGVWYDMGGNVLNWGCLDSDGEPQYRKVTHYLIPAPPIAALTSHAKEGDGG